MAAAEFDRASIFFTRDDRTFHPKLYFGAGRERATLFVGSNNLTPGGLFFNFEAALRVDMERAATAPAEDRELYEAVANYINRLYEDTAVCRPLVPHLETIIRDPAYRVRDETVQRARTGRTVLDPDADREAIQRPSLFGRTSVALRPRVPPGDPIPPSQVGGAPVLGPSARRGVPTRGGIVSRGAPGTRGAIRTPRTTSIVRRRWYKTLPASAAQHPPGPNSQVTGNLRLGQAGHGIDQTSYFRDEFFGGLTWVANTQPRGIHESTTVSMEVVIDGRPLGRREFEVSHAAWREAGQGNTTTFLHLRSISDELRATDYTDRVITLEQLASGDYRLVIDAVEMGPFVR